MRLVIRVAVVGMVLALAQQYAAAQPFGGFRGNPLMLLRQESVQKELKLTPDAVRKIMAFTNEQYEEARKALELDKEERRRKFEALGKENRKFLADNLNPGQRKRLDQITMQLTGLMQLRRPEVARALELTEDQSRKVKEMQTEARKHLRELIDAKDSEGRKEKLAKLREQTRKKVMALLTDKQRAKVRELVGEPFKGTFTRTTMRGKGGRGGPKD